MLARHLSMARSINFLLRKILPTILDYVLERWLRLIHIKYLVQTGVKNVKNKTHRLKNPEVKD